MIENEPHNLAECEYEAALSLNIKRAFMPAMFLMQLSSGELSVSEIVQNITEQSNGLLVPVKPHSVIMRLTANGYVQELGTRCSGIDGRRRKSYAITEKGRTALSEYITVYKAHTEALDTILTGKTTN